MTDTKKTEQDLRQAYLAGMVLKMAAGQSLNSNELQSLENIVSDLGFADIPEDHFRY